MCFTDGIEATLKAEFELKQQEEQQEAPGRLAVEEEQADAQDEGDEREAEGALPQAAGNDGGEARVGGD